METRAEVPGQARDAAVGDRLTLAAVMHRLPDDQGQRPS